MNGAVNDHELRGDALRALLAGHVDAGSGDVVRPHRLSADARRHAPAPLRRMSEFTSGVRLRLRTDADVLELDVSCVRLAMRHLGGPRAAAVFAAVVPGRDPAIAELDTTGLIVETADRRLERGPEVNSHVTLALGEAAAARDIEVWLPHDAGTSIRALRARRAGRPAAIGPAAPDTRPRWLHHGSSISHGGTASTPLRTWPVLAAASLGLDLVNLGFGGNAMLDTMTARTIARTPADVITLKFGINVVGGDAMRERVYLSALHGFLDLVRDGHPDTPLVVVTAVGCAAVETAPGPLQPGPDGRVVAVPRETRPGDGTLTLERTRELAAAAVEDRRRDDPALHLADGLALLRADEGRLLPDGLHPGDEGYELIAGRFAALARDPATGLGAAFAGALDRSPRT